MKNENLEILGLSAGATREEITEAYQVLKAKYLEERFMDGEVGNNAARMLTRIETAYSELTKEMSEDVSSGGGDAYARVEELIKAGNLQDAQRELDNFNERGGRWHYFQSVVFYRKNWTNESKKQLEIAMQLEPDNEQYKDAYRKLNDRINFDAQSGAAGASGTQTQNGQPRNGSTYQGQTMNGNTSDNQMGGNGCAQCLDCCYTYLCVSCLCDGCCR